MINPQDSAYVVPSGFAAPGLSKRELFAMMFMGPLLGSPLANENMGLKEMSAVAVTCADSLLKALEAPPRGSAPSGSQDAPAARQVQP